MNTSVMLSPRFEFSAREQSSQSTYLTSQPLANWQTVLVSAAARRVKAATVPTTICGRRQVRGV